MGVMALIKNFEQLGTTPERKVVLEVVEAGLMAIQPANVLANWRPPDGDYDRIFLIGFGKGSAAIAKIIEQRLGDSLTAGYVIDTTPETFAKIQFTLGTHPLPSETNVNFTRNLVAQLTKLTPSDLVLVVVCGGGSALFTDPTVPIERLIALNEELLKSGKNIAEMNAERKRWDRVKGGGLARLLSPAKVIGLIFSDVPGNDLATIASGPTVAPNAENILLVSNLTALFAMKKKAEELGYGAKIVTDRLQGEARIVGAELVKRVSDTLVQLYGGETTVTVKGDGKGGRNQELVLGAIATEQLDRVTIASVGTDGWDNSEAAGAIGDQTTVAKARSLGLRPEEFLANNDSYSFFQKVGDGLATGRLPMNVADLVVVLRP